MGKNKRKGDVGYSKLTPGERAINWAKAFVVVVPLLGLGALGGAKLPAMLSDSGLGIPDGQLVTPDAEATADAFHAQVRQSLTAINAAVNANTISIRSTRNYVTAATDIVDKRVDEVQMQLNQSDVTNYQNLQEQMDIVKELVN